jgi:hypothetical protein
MDESNIVSKEEIKKRKDLARFILKLNDCQFSSEKRARYMEMYNSDPERAREIIGLKKPKED